VSAFIKPSETAVAAIQRSDADVVIVDGTDIWYGQDLVRNDPFLRTLPKTLLLSKLDATRLTELCRRYDVALFDRTDAERIGMAIVPRPLRLTQRARELRPVMQSLGCGHPILAGR